MFCVAVEQWDGLMVQLKRCVQCGAKIMFFINVSVVPRGVQQLLSLLAVTRELTPPGIVKCRQRTQVVGGAVRRRVKSGEGRGSLSRVVDSQRRGNALGVWRLYAESRTFHPPSPDWWMDLNPRLGGVRPWRWGDVA